jgi:hypothetical protein
MNKKARIAAIGALLALALVSAVQADGGVPCSPGWGYYGYLPSYVYVRDYIPYYALHPPVYYSLPVPRTYGYSPFAYPPGTMTPEIAEPEPLVVPNKFVPSKAHEPEAEPGRLTHQPLRIANPYVLAEKHSAAPETVAAAP